MTRCTDSAGKGRPRQRHGPPRPRGWVPRPRRRTLPQPQPSLPIVPASGPPTLNPLTLAMFDAPAVRLVHMAGKARSRVRLVRVISNSSSGQPDRSPPSHRVRRPGRPPLDRRSDRLADQGIRPQGPPLRDHPDPRRALTLSPLPTATRRPPPRLRPRHRGSVCPNRARSGSSGEYGAKFSIRADSPRSEYVWRRSVKPRPSPCCLLFRPPVTPFRAGLRTAPRKESSVRMSSYAYYFSRHSYSAICACTARQRTTRGDRYDRCWPAPEELVSAQCVYPESAVGVADSARK
jgi:hypothetical protein